MQSSEQGSKSIQKFYEENFYSGAIIVNLNHIFKLEPSPI